LAPAPTAKGWTCDLGTAFLGETGARYGASNVCRRILACEDAAFGELRLDTESMAHAIVEGA
jgi:hypothetical protein